MARARGASGVHATIPRKAGKPQPLPYSGPQIALCVLGTPRSGKNSSRQATNRKTGARFPIKSKAAASWLESAIAQLVAQRKQRPAIDGACWVNLDVYHTLPLTSWDVDNVTNLVYDALKHAHIIADDKAAIVRQGSQMGYVDKSTPRVEITIQRCTRPLAENRQAA